MSESFRARGRREAAEDEADRRAHERPNEPQRPYEALLDCPDSKYGVHRFVARSAAGLTSCEFCGQTLRAWLDKKRGRG